MKEGMVGWRFDDLSYVSAIMRILFNQQNALYQKLGLSEEMNMRIAEEIAQLIEGSLS
jgi:hypothetical protein